MKIRMTLLTAAAVLASGGGVTVRIGGAERKLAPWTAPPQEPFQLVEVSYWGNYRVGDDLLRPLRGLPHLRAIHLLGTRVTDAGVRHLDDLPRLETLDLTSTMVTDGGLAGLDPAQFAQVTIAYEPVWAIGTGKTATPEIASDAHAVLRAEVVARFGGPAADAVRILYGGSVKPDNVKELMAKNEIDGALVMITFGLACRLLACSKSRWKTRSSSPTMILAICVCASGIDETSKRPILPAGSLPPQV